MAAMLKQHERGLPGHTAFPRRVRNICTDRYKPNYIGEEAFKKVPCRNGIDVCHVPCHAHILASGVTWASKQCKGDIDGMKIAYLLCGSLASCKNLKMLRVLGC